MNQSRSLLKLAAALCVVLTGCPSGTPAEQPPANGITGGAGGGNGTPTGGGGPTGSGGGQGETPPEPDTTADAGTPVDTQPDSGMPGEVPDAGPVQRPIADRILFFYVPHGVDPIKFLPTGTGKDFTLSPLMKALEPYKSKLTIVQGQKSPKPPGKCRGPAHYGPGTYFSGTAKVGISLPDELADICVPVSPTIDQAIAQEFGQKNRYPSLNFGIFTAPAFADAVRYQREAASYVQEDKPTVTVTDPKALIDDVLASKGSPEAREAFLKLQSARAALGSTLNASQHYRLLARLDLDLAVQAFRADLSRVAFVHFSMYTSSAATPSLLFASHSDSAEGFYVVHEWFLAEYAHVLEQLASTREADGSTMLDHTLVVWVTETGERLSHEQKDIAAIVAGNASGRLNQGQVVTVNGFQVDLFLTLAKALGSKATTFGDPALNAKPIAEMLK